MLIGKWINLLRRRVNHRVHVGRRARRENQVAGRSIETLQVRILPTITFQFDYSLDATNFFDPIDHPERRQILEQAGNELGSRLQDTLVEIIPHKFNVADTWTATFEDPATGGDFNVDDLILGENILRVYVGARQLGSSLGSGGPGFVSNVTGVQQWVDIVLGRGQAGAIGPDNAQTDFGPFGGSIAFDEDTNWHFGTSTAELESGEFDFFSTAIHELAHVIGFGTSPSFSNLVSGGVFQGSSAILEYDGFGPVPMENPGHWRKDLEDNGAEVSLDPDLADGVRKNLTALDYAGLNDLGWQVDGGDAYLPTVLLASNFSNSLVIQDDGIAGNGLSEYILNGEPPVSFSTLDSDLLFTGGNNDDTISILSIDSSFTGEIIVNASGGDDLLEMDHSIADVVTYNGQLGNDSLALQGNTVSSVTHSFTNASDGSVLIASASNSTVFYTGLEPIFDSILAVNRFFDFGGTDDSITLDDEGIPDNGILRLSSVSSSETVHFSNAIGTVVIDAGDGDDSVTILPIDSGFTAAIEVRGGSGNDTINASAAATAFLLNGNAGNDTVTGGAGNDILSGEAGDDLLQGGSGNDSLFGNEDADQLQGGEGDDSLDGGAGTDTIVEAGDVDFTLDPTTLIGLGSDEFVEIEQALLAGGDSANVIDASHFSGPVTVLAHGGNDTVTGSDYDDHLSGGNGHDRLNGGLGIDIVNGEGGDDQLLGGDGDDILLGGSGHDTLFGESGNDDLRGHAQDDVLTGGDGDDTIDGGAGSDLLVESVDNNLTLTDISLVGIGVDQLADIEVAELFGGFSANVINASAFSGSAILRGLSGSDTLIGGSGNDILIGYAGQDSLVGNAGNDTLLGSAGGDTLEGGSGSDRLLGQGGSHDQIFGGTGDDELDGGPGHDSLFGGEGHDTLSGDSGDDQLNGGTGDDSLLGDIGFDTLNGEAGDDTLVGGDGDDFLFGQAGNDGLDGGAGNDIVNGGADSDTMFGGSGNDSMYGGAGSDLLIGMSGADVVKGQSGFDILAGGSGGGADTGDVVDGEPDEIDEIFSITFPGWVESEL